MKKVTILALHLGYGGIERAITDLANNIVSDYDVTIVSTYKLYDEPVNKLNKNVKVLYLSQLKPNNKEFKTALKRFKFTNAIKEGLKSIKILKLKKKLMINYIKQCNSDIIISTRDIHNKWLSKYGNNKSLKIGWEHNHHHGNKKYANRIIKSSRGLDYLVLVSKDLTKFYQEKTNTKCIYIPNMIEKADTTSSLKAKNIISIGRLSQEKGFLDLLDVFAIVNKEYHDWHLNIVGDGNEYHKIVKKIKKLGLQDNVVLHGYLKKEQINRLFDISSIYVMSSFTESFGIVLLESFSHGIPCVAFDSAEGAREIIINNKNGFLVKERDKRMMADKICQLIKSYDLRVKMGEKGLEKSKLFEPNKVIKKWKQIMK